MLWPDDLWPQEIGALAVLDGRCLLDPGGRFRIEAVRQRIDARLHLVPRFRQLLHVPRRGLGGPLWVDADTFDLRDHVQVLPLPAPGDEAQLLLATEQLRSRRLDRSRPLWEMWFLPGLPDGRVGLFVRMHHAIADGIAGVATLGAFLDAVPDAPAGSGPPWTPAPFPPARDLFADNVRRQVDGLGRALSTVAHPGPTLRQVRTAWPAMRDLLAEEPPPTTSLDHTVGPDRSLAVVRSRLDLVREVAHTPRREGQRRPPGDHRRRPARALPQSRGTRRRPDAGLRTGHPAPGAARSGAGKPDRADGRPAPARGVGSRRAARADRRGDRPTEGAEPPSAGGAAPQPDRPAGPAEDPGQSTGERDHRRRPRSTAAGLPGRGTDARGVPGDPPDREGVPGRGRSVVRRSSSTSWRSPTGTPTRTSTSSPRASATNSRNWPRHPRQAHAVTSVTPGPQRSLIAVILDTFGGQGV